LSHPRRRGMARNLSRTERARAATPRARRRPRSRRTVPPPAPPTGRRSPIARRFGEEDRQRTRLAGKRNDPMNRAWPAIFPIALLPLIFHWMPLWRRNGIWFGVTVAPGYTDGPEARSVLHRFRIAIWLLALAAVTVTALGAPADFPWAFPAAMTLELAGALPPLAHARRQTPPHAASPTPPPSPPLSGS